MTDCGGLGLVARYLRQPGAVERRGGELHHLLREFVKSGGGRGATSDKGGGNVNDAALQPLLNNLPDALALQHEEDDPLGVLFLQTIKILLRRAENRRAMGGFGVSAVVQALKDPRHMQNAKECCNVVLNMCYDTANVDLFIQLRGVAPLLTLLRVPDTDVQCAALGALQSICYSPTGRVAVREAGAIELLAVFIQHEDMKVVERAMGTLHNLSADAHSISEIRSAAVIDTVVQLLRCANALICGAAAGCLQNVSRETASRDVILRNTSAVPFLADLLVGSNVLAQASATGALLNVLSPGMEEADQASLRQALTDAVVLGVILTCLSEHPQAPPPVSGAMTSTEARAGATPASTPPEGGCVGTENGRRASGTGSGAGTGSHPGQLRLSPPRGLSDRESGASGVAPPLPSFSPTSTTMKQCSSPSENATPGLANSVPASLMAIMAPAAHGPSVRVGQEAKETRQQKRFKHSKAQAALQHSRSVNSIPPAPPLALSGSERASSFMAQPSSNPSIAMRAAASAASLFVPKASTDSAMTATAVRQPPARLSAGRHDSFIVDEL